MKTIDKLYDEVLRDDNLRKEFLNVAVKEGGIEKFLKDHGCDATQEDVLKFIKKKRNISDEEMESISGGKGIAVRVMMV